MMQIISDKYNPFAMLQFAKRNITTHLQKHTDKEGYTVRIKCIRHITHDTLCIMTNKPEGFSFLPGQGCMVSINKNGWRDKKRPFTFTNLPDNGHLEFIIKTYPSRKGFTNQLHELSVKDELILHEVFGTLTYSKEGIFIAGGAGITPFVSIFRDLERKNQIRGNKLILANKRKSDIILEEEFIDILGIESFINILSDERRKGYHYGLVNTGFLKSVVKDFNKHFYVCGPPLMVEAVEKQLFELNVPSRSITKEVPVV
jgi:ferredoxin-NADP reductase